jgi:hypothetical protein
MLDHVMNYIESEAPADLTLVEWRRSRASTRKRRRLILFPRQRAAALAV